MSNALEFPISIALIGAPGSGKSDIAAAYKDIADPWFAVNEAGPLNVIENPGNVIQDELDTAMGLAGGWKEDLRVFFRRYEQEQKFRATNESFITLGTALENLAHCGVNMENIIRSIQTEEQQQALQIQQIAMTQLTYLFTSTFQYTFAFYVPKTGVILSADGSEIDTEANYNRRVDEALRMVFANFGIRIQSLDEGSPEEKAKVVFDTIARIVENGPEGFVDPNEGNEDAPSLDAEEVPPSESATVTE